MSKPAILVMLHEHLAASASYGSAMLLLRKLSTSACIIKIADLQIWVEVMGWYAGQRSRMASEVKKYSDPTSDRLLPDLHPQMR